MDEDALDHHKIEVAGEIAQLIRHSVANNEAVSAIANFIVDAMVTEPRTFVPFPVITDKELSEGTYFEDGWFTVPGPVLVIPTPEVKPSLSDIYQKVLQLSDYSAEFGRYEQLESPSHLGPNIGYTMDGVYKRQDEIKRLLEKVTS